MNRNQWIKLAIAALVVYILFRMLSKRRESYREYAPYGTEDYNDWDDNPETWETVAPGSITNRPVTTTGPSSMPMTPQPLAASVDLLPKTSPAPRPGQASWAEFAPQSLQGQQFLDPAKYIGTDTQGSSLKNASWDLRKAPPIPRSDVGPFLMSTIEQDLYRKPLDDCK